MKNLYLYILLLSMSSMFSQDPDNHWQLGVSNVNFSTNPATVSTTANGGKYGVASISDASGNLLFYSNGEYVWNKNHQLMQNSQQSLGGYADPYDNKQSCIIVPYPGNTNKYYLFTAMIDSNLCTDCYTQFVNYKSFIIDFGDPQYPLGKVIHDQNPFYVGDGNFGPLTAVKNANNDGYFVIIGTGTSLRSYKITSLGFDSMNPVISNFTNNMTYDSQQFNSDYLLLSNNSSIIKFSPDNSKIGQLVITDKFFIGPNTSSSKSHFFTLNFNNSTGVFSNFTSVDVSPINVGAYRDFDFSTDSNKTYLIKNSIYVKDLSNLSAPVRNLFATGTTSVPVGFSRIQKDKYGTILLSSNSSTDNRNLYLHRIENPDSFSTSTVGLNYIYLNGNSIGYKPYLPQLINTVPVSPCGNLTITTNIPSGQDNKQGLTITASNTISAGAGAIYHAENSVTLISGFNAVSASNFRAYIEGCTGLFVGKTDSDSITEENENLSENESYTRLYPNPNNGNFTISLNEQIQGEVKFTIFNIYGKLIHQGVQKNSVFDLNISDLSAGLYFVKLEGNNYNETLKFMKK